ncbi:autotransporter domain-containing protein [Bordetella sp. LUAb4]|uniref:autotransporter outer membrane beta-barrel domain-containing protein n=1 Tax=Bordetella sp. LUAb4 TaxID=2843195 RepID=UPI001E3353FC|nr:autotransporter outer membrane beta-barrel domain-containing protein [Bordetella sp. LUAb4]
MSKDKKISASRRASLSFNVKKDKRQARGQSRLGARLALACGISMGPASAPWADEVPIRDPRRLSSEQASYVGGIGGRGQAKDKDGGNGGRLHEQASHGGRGALKVLGGRPGIYPEWNGWPRTAKPADPAGKPRPVTVILMPEWRHVERQHMARDFKGVAGHSATLGGGGGSTGLRLNGFRDVLPGYDGDPAMLHVVVNEEALGGSGGNGKPDLLSLAFLFGGGGGGGGGGTGLAVYQDFGGLTLEAKVHGGQGGSSKTAQGGGGGPGLVVDGLSPNAAVNVPSSHHDSGATVSAPGSLRFTDVVVAPSGWIRGGDGGEGEGRRGRGGPGGPGAILQDHRSMLNRGTIEGGLGGSAPRGLPGRNGAALVLHSHTWFENQGELRGSRQSPGPANPLQRGQGAALVALGDANTVVLRQASKTLGDIDFRGRRNALHVGTRASPLDTVNMAGNLRLGQDGAMVVYVKGERAGRLVVDGHASVRDSEVRAIVLPGGVAASSHEILRMRRAVASTQADDAGRFRGVTAVDEAGRAYVVMRAELVYDQDNEAARVLLKLSHPDDPAVDALSAMPEATAREAAALESISPESALLESTSSEPTASPSSKRVAVHGALERRLLELAETSSQRAVASSIASLPRSHAISAAALSLTEGQPGAFFDSLSGEVHATVATGLHSVGTTVRELPLAQLRGNLGASQLAGAPTAAAGMTDTPPLSGTLPRSGAAPAWAQVLGNWQHYRGRDGSASSRQHSEGIFIGADHDVGSGWRAGGALGYIDSRLRQSSLNSSAGVSSYSAVVYGAKSLALGPGALRWIVGGAYTWHDVRSKRQVSAATLDQKLRADYGASTAQWFSELGYAVPVASGLTMQPYVGLAYADQRRRAFDERGGSAALSGKRARNAITTTTLGVRASHEATVAHAPVKLTMGLGWRHNDGDLRTRAQLFFDAGDGFSVNGAPVARDNLLVETGVRVTVGRWTTLGLAYTGQYGGGSSDHGAQVNLNTRF